MDAYRHLTFDRGLARPKIILGTVTLRLRDGYYHAHGQSEERPSPKLNTDSALWADCDPLAVESALIRFVKNNRISSVTINGHSGGTVTIWKKAKRGEFGVLTDGIPKLDPVLQEALDKDRQRLPFCTIVFYMQQICYALRSEFGTQRVPIVHAVSAEFGQQCWPYLY